MERARVFRTSGPIRILWGLTLTELILMALAGGLVLYAIDATFYIELSAFVLSLLASFVLIRLVKMILKPGAVKHFLTWLREDDHYTPHAEPDPMPLVWIREEP